MTLEAFLSAKPVITSPHSGEPARLVRDGVTGFVTAPTPTGLAEAMDLLVRDPARARTMGRQGQLDIQTSPGQSERNADDSARLYTGRNLANLVECTK